MSISIFLWLSSTKNNGWPRQGFFFFTRCPFLEAGQCTNVQRAESSPSCKRGVRDTIREMGLTQQLHLFSKNIWVGNPGEEGSESVPEGDGNNGEWIWDFAASSSICVFFRAHVSKSVERMAKNLPALQIMIVVVPYVSGCRGIH